MTSIWWIRRDLRLTDNPALHAGMDAGSATGVIIAPFREYQYSVVFLDQKWSAFCFKAEHRVAQRGIYHVYGYKFRPAWNVPTK
jgi:deoxyribodipyrimidine photolyase